LTRKGNGFFPSPLVGEGTFAKRRRMRGYGLTIDRNPSPGSHPAMRSDLSLWER
jgi:hypothetical protein